jgi:hypothetical protein
MILAELCRKMLYQWLCRQIRKIIVVKGMLSRVEDVCQPLVSMNTTLPYEVLF